MENEVTPNFLGALHSLFETASTSKIMKEKNQVVPDEVLSKEFLKPSIGKMLEGKMDAHLEAEKNFVAGNNSGNSRNGSHPKKIQTEHGKSVIPISRDRNGQFEPIAVPKHESRGLFDNKACPDYLYRQSEWIYGYHLYRILSVIHLNLYGTSDQKLL